MQETIDKLEITDPHAAAVLGGTTSRSILLELVGRERSLSGLRAALGMSLNLLHYHLGRMIKFRLVVIAREESRAGRPLKIYAAVAHSFFVPAHLAARDARQALALELDAALEQARMRSREEGIPYSFVPSRGPTMRRIGDRNTDGTELWGRLVLDAKGARELADTLRRLLHDHGRSTEKGGRAYLAHFAFARRDD